MALYIVIHYIMSNHNSRAIFVLLFMPIFVINIKHLIL